MASHDVQRDDACAGIRHLLRERAAAARTQETALRDALAALIEAFEQNQPSLATGDRDEEIAAFVDRLAADAAADADRAATSLHDANAEAARLAAALRQTQEQLDAAAIARDTLDEQLAASTAQIADLEAAIVERSQSATAAATAAAADADRAAQALERAHAESSRLTAALGQTQDQLDATEIARDTLADQLAAATARLEALETTIVEQAHLATSLEEAQRQLQAADRERQTREEDAARQAEQISLIETRVRDQRAVLDHLPVVFRAVAASRTTTDALTAVANGLGGLFPRVALFRARADRLEGVHQSGFDFTGDISNVVIPMTIDSVMSDAVSSNGVTVLTADDLAASHALPFGGTATSAIVLPLSVDGQTMAAVYADDGGQMSETGADERAVCAGLVRDFAMAHVQRLVSDERTLTELNAYAGMLLDEVERMYVADVAGGHDEVTLRGRVLENLQTARRIYAQRVEAEAPAAAAFLEERIVAVARAARTTPFGRDVLEVAFTDGEAAADRTPLPAAQAS
jgi:chemotaxis protein histidine kinase CheA